MYGSEIDTGLSGKQIRIGIEDAFKQGAQAIDDAYQGLFSCPDDIERLHRYRISLRVARSLAKFIAPYQKRPQNRALIRQLKTLQDPTSHIRELDVFSPLVQEYEALHAICEETRLRLRKDFLEQARLSSTRDALTQALDSLAHIDWKGEALSYGIDAFAFAGRIDARQKRCAWEFMHLDFEDEEAVHKLRKNAKALRYVIRELRTCLPESLRDASNSMREMQDALGEWRDNCVNADIAERLGGATGKEAAARFRDQAESSLCQLKALRE